VTEVSFAPGEDADGAISRWSDALDRVFTNLAWRRSERWIRRYKRGASLVITGPVDALYAAIEINDWAVEEAMGRAQPIDDFLEHIRQEIAEESNPALLALQAEAAQRNVPFIWDDDEVSIGLGRHSQTWPSDALPEPEAVDWNNAKTIPYAYITGTNGKTTTTRMTMSIAAAAGISHGGTSSDGVVINGLEVERGDWTGPGAARRVLRDPAVDLALLETARGGMLRRGLVMDNCDAAVVTNVANDHLGDYGIHSVEDMATAKSLVFQTVRPEGQRILNADDPRLWAIGQQPGPEAAWFSLSPSVELQHHLDAGGFGWVVDGDQIVRHRHGERSVVLAASSIPATHGGKARHNIANALAAAALADSLGIKVAAISAGLKGFEGNDEDNPGRCNLLERHGVQFLLDFGHNPHGVRAILSLATALIEAPAARLAVTIGQAGDRSDSDLHELARAVAQAEPSRVLVREIPGYERGRSPGEVSGLLAQSLVEHGQPVESISVHQNEADTMQSAVQWAQPGDLVAHLIHLDRDAVHSVLDTWNPDFAG
jgi:UDP-N-acetylmuramyl tripeptide synthase